MDYKRTQDLLEQLKTANIPYETYLEENEDAFIKNDLCEFWSRVVEISGMTKTDICNKAGIAWTYLYSIMKGEKIPTRDTIIRIFIAMRGSCENCQQALKINNYAQLYPKTKRDSILLYALNHGLSLYQTEELLDKNKEKCLKRTQ